MLKTVSSFSWRGGCQFQKAAMLQLQYQKLVRGSLLTSSQTAFKQPLLVCNGTRHQLTSSRKISNCKRYSIQSYSNLNYWGIFRTAGFVTQGLGKDHQLGEGGYSKPILCYCFIICCFLCIFFSFVCFCLLLWGIWGFDI